MKKTIVQEKRDQDFPYKNSGIQHFVNDLYKGTDRLNLDSRPVAGSDAIFKSYDYSGKNAPSETSPSIGPYWEMDRHGTLSDFLDGARKDRNKKIDEMNRKNPGVYQFKNAKIEKLVHMASVYESRVKTSTP